RRGVVGGQPSLPARAWLRRLSAGRHRPTVAAPGPRSQPALAGQRRQAGKAARAGAGARALVSGSGRHGLRFRRAVAGARRGPAARAGRSAVAAGDGRLMRTLHVELGARRYPISIGSGLLQNASVLERLARGRHALIVTDDNVAKYWLQPVCDALAGKHLHTIVLPPGEQEKNLERFGEVIAALAELGASRDATVFALGGGVVGDLAGFAAACWMRGVRFVQLPTTLLAMVDSSVGGKTAVDLAQGKNLVGAFHQPAAVLADVGALSTLPPRELRAGLAEVVKAAAIADAGFFGWLEANADALLAGEEAALEQAIGRSVAFKAGVV